MPFDGPGVAAPRVVFFGEALHEAEVGDFDHVVGAPPVCEHDVSGFDVAVDEADGMCFVEREGCVA